MPLSAMRIWPGRLLFMPVPPLGAREGAVRAGTSAALIAVAPAAGKGNGRRGACYSAASRRSARSRSTLTSCETPFSRMVTP